jgi:cell division protein FtsB
VSSALTSSRPLLKRWAARLALAVALAISLAYVPYRLLDPVGARHVRELRAQQNDTRARNAQLKVENTQLRREIDGLRNDPSVIEDIAREDLGMVREREIIIRIEKRAKGSM